MILIDPDNKNHRAYINRIDATLWVRPLVESQMRLFLSDLKIAEYPDDAPIRIEEWINIISRIRCKPYWDAWHSFVTYIFSMLFGMVLNNDGHHSDR